MSDTDRITKQVTLRAPRARVWRALADAKEFGAWFGAALEGSFVAGQTMRGRITYPGYEHLTFEAVVERVEPESYLAYRWHPAAIERGVDYSSEPMTLVEFRLEDSANGTLLTIVESGFDQIPLARRATAFRMNGDGWAEQLTNIERHVAR